jgi:hypothetical protein
MDAMTIFQKTSLDEEGVMSGSKSATSITSDHCAVIEAARAKCGKPSNKSDFGYVPLTSTPLDFPNDGNGK